MSTYNIQSLAEIIYNLCTRGFNGTYPVSQEDCHPLTVEGVVLEHFMCADPETIHQGEQGAYINVNGIRVCGHRHFLRRDYKGVPEDMVKVLEDAQDIRIENVFGDWTSYRKEDKFFIPLEEHFECNVREAGKHFTLYAGVRDEALRQLTDGREMVLDGKFHAAFDTALKIAQEKFETR